MADLKTLLSDKDFMKGIVEMETPEEVQKAFKDKGVELSTEQVQEIGEIINATLEKGSTLSESELEEISGGGNKTFKDGITSIWDGGLKDSLTGDGASAGSRVGAVASVGVPLAGIGVVGAAVGVGLTFIAQKAVKWAKNRKKH